MKKLVILFIVILASTGAEGYAQCWRCCRQCQRPNVQAADVADMIPVLSPGNIPDVPPDIEPAAPEDSSAIPGIPPFIEPAVPEAPSVQEEAVPHEESASAFEASVAACINEERIKAGLRPLEMVQRQCLFARRHSQRMAAWGGIFHDSTGCAECVARIGGGASGVARLWLNSPPHRAILMSPNATRVTVGSFGPFHTARVW